MATFPHVSAEASTIEQRLEEDGMNGRILILITGAVTVIAIAGCTAPTPPVPPTSPPPITASTPTATDELVSGEWIALANAQNEPEGTVVQQVSARPSTVVDAAGHAQTRTLRDEAEAQIVPGAYGLNVVCVGRGHVTAEFRIGAESISRDLQCGERSGGGGVTLTLQTASTTTAVTLTPHADTRAAIAYHIVRA